MSATSTMHAQLGQSQQLKFDDQLSVTIEGKIDFPEIQKKTLSQYIYVRWCSIASPLAPCVLCLAERRRLAVAGMSPRRNRPPPALRTPPVPFIKPRRATAGRRASFAALRNAMSVIGTVSSDHRFRPARAIASAIRELRFGTREHFPQEHRSARERRPLRRRRALTAHREREALPHYKQNQARNRIIFFTRDAGRFE